jgi:hypothetical protein
MRASVGRDAIGQLAARPALASAACSQGPEVALQRVEDKGDDAQHGEAACDTPLRHPAPHMRLTLHLRCRALETQRAARAAVNASARRAAERRHTSAPRRTCGATEAPLPRRVCWSLCMSPPESPPARGGGEPAGWRMGAQQRHEVDTRSHQTGCRVQTFGELGPAENRCARARVGRKSQMRGVERRSEAGTCAPAPFSNSCVLPAARPGARERLSPCASPSTVMNLRVLTWR